jgi:uncharacterized repeat protein (TIGR03837 family)
MTVISIFCKAIDNYGDVGVCLRLAKNLIAFHAGVRVNLYIDCLQTLNAIVKTHSITQINIICWDAIKQDSINYDNADAVINAFACKLPAIYQHNMPADIKWIQLDYLATELWADEYNYMHAFIGKHKRIFITPGFNANTAGLLTRDYINHSHHDLCCISAVKTFKMMAFIYLNQASIDGLLHFLRHANVEVYMHSSLLQQLQHSYPQHNEQWQHIKNSPFVLQHEFDDLLETFDILWVRGEDSFVRAQLTAKPMLWQAYPQEQNSHHDKLDGFLAQYISHEAHTFTPLINILNCINGKTSWQYNTVNDFMHMLSYNTLYAQHLQHWKKYLLDRVPCLDVSIMGIINQ